MSPFTFHQTPSDAIYDLHAVCSHHGVMNFGHYITYSKPYSPDELSALGLAGIDGMYNIIINLTWSLKVF